MGGETHAQGQGELRRTRRIGHRPARRENNHQRDTRKRRQSRNRNRQVQSCRYKSPQQQRRNNHRRSATDTTVILPSTHALRSIQSHHGTHTNRREVRQCEESLFHQYTILRPRQRQRLPLPRQDPPAYTPATD